MFKMLVSTNQDFNLGHLFKRLHVSLWERRRYVIMWKPSIYGLLALNVPFLCPLLEARTEHWEVFLLCSEHVKLYQQRILRDTTGGRGFLFWFQYTCVGFFMVLSPSYQQCKLGVYTVAASSHARNNRPQWAPSPTSAQETLTTASWPWQCISQARSTQAMSTFHCPNPSMHPCIHPPVCTHLNPGEVPPACQSQAAYNLEGFPICLTSGQLSKLTPCGQQPRLLLWDLNPSVLDGAPFPALFLLWLLVCEGCHKNSIH